VRLANAMPVPLRGAELKERRPRAGARRPKAPRRRRRRRDRSGTRNAETRNSEPKPPLQVSVPTSAFPIAYRAGIDLDRYAPPRAKRSGAGSEVHRPGRWEIVTGSGLVSQFGPRPVSRDSRPVLASRREKDSGTSKGPRFLVAVLAHVPARGTLPRSRTRHHHVSHRS